MTSFVTLGFWTGVDLNDPSTTLRPNSEFVIVAPETGTAFDYRFFFSGVGVLPFVQLDSDFFYGAIDGDKLGNGTTQFGVIEWEDETGNSFESYVLKIRPEASTEVFSVVIAGDALPEFTTLEEYTDFYASQVTYVGAARSDSGFYAGDTIELTDHAELWSVVENDNILGTDEDDSIDAGTGADDIWAGLGNDNLFGGKGRDAVYGQDGDDFISGGGGSDYLVGGGGDDLIEGGDGNDRINGGKNADVVFGENGNDKIYGNGGRDILEGGAGADAMFGGGGNDALSGGSGNDTLNGGRGRDVLTDQDGADILTGGSDKDAFVFNANSDFGNVIIDFQDGVDLIGLSGYTLNDLSVEDQGGSTLIATDDWSVLLQGVEISAVSTADFAELF